MQLTWANPEPSRPDATVEVSVPSAGPTARRNRKRDQVVSSRVSFRGTFSVWYFLNFSLGDYIQSR